MGITLRRLTSDDWHTFKVIRLEALAIESYSFGGKSEAALTDDEWQWRLTDDGTHAFWGLYDDADCVGITGIIEMQGDPDAVYLIASYLRREYRGQGLSALFYQARLDWAREHGFKTAVVAHRDGNEASRAANQKFGFVYSHSEDTVWPDGSQNDKLIYKLPL